MTEPGISDVRSDGGHVPGLQGPRSNTLYCAQGHRYSPENTGWSQHRSGRWQRYCRACKRERSKAHRIAVGDPTGKLYMREYRAAKRASDITAPTPEP